MFFHQRRAARARTNASTAVTLAIAKTMSLRFISTLKTYEIFQLATVCLSKEKEPTSQLSYQPVLSHELAGRRNRPSPKLDGLSAEPTSEAASCRRNLLCLDNAVLKCKTFWDRFFLTIDSQDSGLGLEKHVPTLKAVDRA